MTQGAVDAFQQGSGFSVPWLHWVIELLVGGMGLVTTVALLVGLMKLLEGELVEKARLKLYLMALAVYLSLLVLVVLQ